jgi:hypothetical protein
LLAAMGNATPSTLHGIAEVLVSQAPTEV